MSGWAGQPERSPVAARMAWLLDATKSRALSADEAESAFALPALVDQAGMVSRVNGPWPVESYGEYDELSATFARLHLVGADGHRRALRIGIEDEWPHRIRYASRFHAPDDVTVRPATEVDGAALADLERRTPVIDAGVERRYERGDWFGQLRLMDEVIVVVAEIDDVIVGVLADAVRTTQLAGDDYRLLYRFRLRVAPSVKGRFVFPALNGGAVDIRIAAASVGWGFDSEETHLALGNEHMRTVASTVSSNMQDWVTQVERLVIDCAHGAGAPAGRPASPEDASTIAAILSRGRSEEAGYPEMTPTSVAARFARAGSTYGWPDVRMSDEAVLGVWDEMTSMTTVVDGIEHREAHAIAADYACTPGNEDQLVTLTRAACSDLASRGITHLVFHTSQPARHRNVLLPLATRIERFSRRCRVPEPPRAPTHGVYVDPVYF